MLNLEFLVTMTTDLYLSLHYFLYSTSANTGSKFLFNVATFLQNYSSLLTFILVTRLWSV